MVELDCDRFLSGQAYIPFSLLQGINISILNQLFSSLGKPSHSKICTVLLIMIIKLSTRSQIKRDSIGLLFFKNLLSSRDPAIV